MAQKAISEPAKTTTPADRFEGLFSTRRYDHAIVEGVRLLKVSPQLHGVKFKLGLALRATNRTDEAIIVLAELLNDLPGNVQVMQKIAEILKDQRKYHEAAQFFIHLMQADPARSAVALWNLGQISSALGNYADAADFFRAGLRHDPEEIEMLKDLVGVLAEAGDVEDAILLSQDALKKHPTAEDLRGFLISQLQNTCDWAGLSEQRQFFSSLGTKSKPVAPFALMPVDGDPASQLARMRNFTASKMPNIPRKRLDHLPLAGRRIRIGYFSSDFYNHATMDLMSGLLRAHDRQDFEIHLFSYGPKVEDEGAALARKYSDHFHSVQQMTSPQIAALSRELGIDVAIDLKGHTKGGRPAIFGYSAAPIHVNFLGYPGSLGSDIYDYMIVDRVVVHDGEERYYDEKLIFMPGSYQPNDDQRERPEIGTSRADEGLPEDGFVFCCLNNAYKILPEEFALWMQILKATDGSVLYLFARNEIAKHNLKAAAAHHGVDPERLVFAKPVGSRDHLARLRHADVFLDTFICNAHTTAAEALWMGVPVITKSGRTFASRVAGSLLSALEMDQLSVDTNEAYVRLALRLAQDRNALRKIREEIERKRKTTALFDTTKYARAFEKALKTAVSRSFEKKAAEHIYL